MMRQIANGLTDQAYKIELFTYVFEWNKRR